MGNDFPAKSKTGQLRLVRNGSVLSYLVADGANAEFVFLNHDTFGNGDLKNVRIGGTTGSLGLSLDARVTSLHVRAEALPKLAAPPPAKAATSMLPLIIAVGLALTAGIPLSVWLFVWQRRRASGRAPRPADADMPTDAEPAAQVISFTCPACAKNLKARATLGGKKVKCPKCAHVVLAPDATKVRL